MASEWHLQSSGEVVFGLEDFYGHVGKQIDGFEDEHGGYGIGKRNVEERLFEFCNEKNCVWQIHGLKRRSREK